MAEQVSWDSIKKSSEGNKDFPEYLKLASGQTYKIRPLFSPVTFFKYFVKDSKGNARQAICADPNTCPVKDRHPDLEKAKRRFAVYVIDRADGKVKILESGVTVFRPFGERLELTGKNPGGGKDGSDWYIKVEGSKMQTKYSVGYLKDTPLTESEIALVKEALDGDKEKLQKLYKADTPQEIEKKLFGNPASKEKDEVEDIDMSGDTDDFAEDSDNATDDSDFNF